MAQFELVPRSVPPVSTKYRRIATPIPVPGSSPTILLDAGAHAECAAPWLLQFAQMGAVLAIERYGIAQPRVGLLSIGEEETKGNALVKEAHGLLKNGLHTGVFIGNVEGRDLTRFVADVVVCDAVLGNVVIKFFEGLSLYIFDLLRAEFYRSLRGKLAGLLFQPSISRIRAQFDYEVVGGSPLLGVNGTLIITHGSARRRMIWFALETTARTVRERVNERIASSLGLDAEIGAAAPSSSGNDAATDEADAAQTVPAADSADVAEGK